MYLTTLHGCFVIFVSYCYVVINNCRGFPFVFRENEIMLNSRHNRMQNKYMEMQNTDMD